MRGASKAHPRQTYRRCHDKPLDARRRRKREMQRDPAAQ
jgi:hypothetical protein